ncbi:MAG: potassium channel family protein [Nanobdellota archaeon]
MARFKRKIFNKIKHRNFKTFIDSLEFKNLLIVWLIIIACFAIYFNLASTQNNFLYYDSLDKKVQGFPDSLYFSFITASTLGYGDIVPIGLFKMVAVIEILLGLLMIAMVTSKIISIKQDVILSEIYDISFKEGISRLRSSLFRFKHNIESITKKIKEDTIKKHDLDQLYIYLCNFEDSLQEILVLHKRSTKYYFLKKWKH